MERDKIRKIIRKEFDIPLPEVRAARKLMEMGIKSADLQDKELQLSLDVITLDEKDMGYLAFKAKKFLYQAAIDLSRTKLRFVNRKSSSGPKAVSKKQGEQVLWTEDHSEQVLDHFDDWKKWGILSDTPEQKELLKNKILTRMASECIESVDDREVQIVLMAYWLDLFDINNEKYKDYFIYKSIHDSHFETRFEEIKKRILEKHVEKKSHLFVYYLSEKDIQYLLNIENIRIVRNLLKRAKNHIVKWTTKNRSRLNDYLEN